VGPLPLAIALVADHLRSHPTWDIRHVADRLANPRTRSDRLAAGDRSVAVSPAPIVDERAAAACVGCSVSDARHRLDRSHADILLLEPEPPA